jgi:hypothetical protein
MRGIVGFVVALALTLAFSSVALAGPRDTQYGSQTEEVTTQQPKPVVQVSGTTKTQEQPTVAKAAQGALPFTGTDLGIAIAAGAALVGGGLYLRRMGRPRDTDS